TELTCTGFGIAFHAARIFFWRTAGGASICSSAAAVSPDRLKVELPDQVKAARQFIANLGGDVEVFIELAFYFDFTEILSGECITIGTDTGLLLGRLF
ncbi:MAG: hypothetical protein WCE56_18965, partial [Desulfobacterales bacterium]